MTDKNQDENCSSSGKAEADALAARIAKVEIAQNRTESSGKWLLAGSIAASACLFTLGATALTFWIDDIRGQKVGEGDVVLNNRGGHPLRIQQHYMSIEAKDIWRLPLAQIEKLATLTLEFKEDEYGGPRQYYYTVESLFRDLESATTEVRLSSNHHLLASEEEAVLTDEGGTVLGVLAFADEDDEEYGADDVEDSSEIRNTDEKVGETAKRRLGKKKKGKKGKPITPGPGGEEAYCMYGCGQLAVTYPYYYRPFFGYGYPLVGTDAQFPRGYGGNPVTELAAQGVIGPHNTPGPLTGNMQNVPSIQSLARGV